MSGKQISESSYKLHLVALLEEKLHHVHVQDVDACPTEHNLRFKVTWLLEGLMRASSKKESKQMIQMRAVEFVIQILKKAAKLASEAEARRREAWAEYLCKS